MNTQYVKKNMTNRGWIYSKFSIRNHTTHFINFYKKKQPKNQNELSNELHTHEKNKRFNKSGQKINSSKNQQDKSNKQPKQLSLSLYIAPNSAINNFIQIKQKQSNMNKLSKQKQNDCSLKDKNEQINDKHSQLNDTKLKAKYIPNVIKFKQTQQKPIVIKQDLSTNKLGSMDNKLELNINQLNLKISQKSLTHENMTVNANGNNHIPKKLTNSHRKLIQNQILAENKSIDPNKRKKIKSQFFQNQDQIKQNKDFKATNCGRYKRQLMFLKPQMIRNSSSTLNNKRNKNPSNQTKDLQQNKSIIYKQITKSLYINTHISDSFRQKRSASISQYQPIQYMTQYTDTTNYQRRNTTSTVHTNINYMQNEENSKGIRNSLKTAGNYRKKPNITVLRDKLKNHYNNKNSQYRQKVYGFIGKQEQQQTFLIED